MWWLRERNRKRGGGEEREKNISHHWWTEAQTSRKHIKQGQHQFHKVILQFSYSSTLLRELRELKDTQRTANCVHLKQNSGYAGHYHTVERYYPPVTSSCSYQTVFLQGEWGRKEILSGTAQNEEKKDC